MKKSLPSTVVVYLSSSLPNLSDFDFGNMDLHPAHIKKILGFEPGNLDANQYFISAPALQFEN